MKKFVLPFVVVSAVFVVSPVFASKLVTPDVPLDSVYYRQLDKMEAMGFITDMSGATKPYSRYQVAKMLAKVNPKGMQPYLKKYYDGLCDEFSDEIAYIIVHEPFVKKQVFSKKNREKHHQEYYAHKNNYLVSEKVKLALPKHFPSNVGMRSAKVEFSNQSMDQAAYAYRRTNANYQPLHGNDNGNRYGDGFNAVGKFTLSGSISEQVALSLTPRVSWDKDNHAKFRLDEGYARTHLGMWGITAGKQALNWSSSFGSSGVSISNNAKPQTMVRLGLLEPFEFKDTWLRKLGKIDFQFFASKLEHNRRSKYGIWKHTTKTSSETNDAHLWGMRVEFTPNDTFTLGLERISQMKKFGKNYFFIRNDGIDKGNDFGNDQNGIDFRWKMPGVQLYGGIYGEDGTTDIWTMFMSNKFKKAGIYFPQLSKNGSLDLRLEYNENSSAWYSHSTPFGNGWSYHENIMGDPMGGEAKKVTVEINKYLNNGDRLGLTYMGTKWDKEQKNAPDFKEYQINYSHILKEHLHLDAALGLADINNANYEKGKKDKAKYVALGLRWEF